MPITFNNPHLGLGKRDIKFAGEVPGRADPIICSIDRLALADFANLSDATDDAQIEAAFNENRLLITMVAAAQWRAGDDRPKVSYQDLMAVQSAVK